MPFRGTILSFLNVSQQLPMSCKYIGYTTTWQRAPINQLSQWAVLKTYYLITLLIGSCSRVMWPHYHYDDVMMTMLASQITSLTVVYSIVYSGVNQRKHQSSASLAFVREIHRGPVNFPHKWPVTRKMFPVDDVIMIMTQRPHSD